MRRFINPLLLWASHSRHADLIRQLQYLKVENEILRSKLPRQFKITHPERERLVRFARPVGRAIRDLCTIVTIGTFYKWLNGHNWKTGSRPRGPGRPRTPQEVEDLVLRIARDTGWGYTRILGELKKLHLNRISRSTVVNILKRAGLETGPARGQATWDEFIKRHAETLWGCDYLPRRILTLRGWRDAYVLIFINVKTRMAWVSPASLAPTWQWSAQQAEDFIRSPVGQMHGQPRIVLHDRDPRFGPLFKQALTAREVTPVRTQLCSPNLNAHVERFIQTLQKECLNHFMVFGCQHMDYLVREFLEHYHTERPHQSLGNQPLARAGPPPFPSNGDIECRSRLGGVLRHYRRAA